MKLTKFLSILFLLCTTNAWAESNSPNPEPDSALAAAQPGELARLEIRATSLLFYGTAIGLAGVEVGWVSPHGFTAELQAFSLIGLSGSGWQVTARVGRRWDDTSRLVLHENRFYSGITPLFGVRYGEFPWMGTSDGYDYKSKDLGVQAGIAFDWGYGSLNGFASRIELLTTWTVYTDPNYGGDWTYAGGLNPTVTFDIGILFGGFFSVE